MWIVQFAKYGNPLIVRGGKRGGKKGGVFLDRLSSNGLFSKRRELKLLFGKFVPLLGEEGEKEKMSDLTSRRL